MRQRRVIAVTGTPGSGKTTVAKKLAKKLGARLLDTKKYAKQKKLAAGYDRKRKTTIIDEKALSRALSHELSREKRDVVLDGTLSTCAAATHALVLRASPTKLAQRLKKRGYSKQKIRENIEAELLGICLAESLRTKNILEVDATDGADETKILRWLEKGGRRIKNTDWFKDYKKLVTAR